MGISKDILIELCKDAKHAFLSAFKEKVMKHSQALLLLSSDFGTAWNARRWIIKMISRTFSTPQLQEIITKESGLVELIGERSKMNYRAWYHCCWLVSYMTTQQVLEELNKSKRWAGLHVADSSCFHYRRVLETYNVEGSNTYDKTEAHKIWMEELDWNRELVIRYLSRESFETGQSMVMNEEISTFIVKEIHLLESSMTVPNTKFEDFQAQALHAAVYMLWLIKNVLELWRMLKEKLGTEKNQTSSFLHQLDIFAADREY
ncbi:hypothetical protein N665_0172s0035 [Sinapis alba]|nr:hypothetical protein N665_0172s0035 [Sinapis alba]